MQLDRAEGGREQTMPLQPTKDTHKSFSKARESKIPGDSSVRSLELRILEETRDEIHQIIRVGSISRPTAHHH